MDIWRRIYLRWHQDLQVNIDKIQDRRIGHCGTFNSFILTNQNLCKNDVISTVCDSFLSELVEYEN